MGISGEIAKDVFRSAKGRLDVNHPLAVLEGRDPILKTDRVSEFSQVPIELKTAVGRECESEAESALNNGERQFELEQVAPRDGFELLLTVERPRL
jgi:hypothetical protein